MSVPTYHTTCCYKGVFQNTGSKVVGRDNSVDIATRNGLYGRGIESLWRAKFSAPVQTSPGAHPASCTVRTWSPPRG
jgi:hypothetical protein